ncbi:MAG: DUF3592 domain-containing protein [Haloarculaceae archaeon]
MSEDASLEESLLMLLVGTIFCLAFVAGGVFLYQQQEAAIRGAEQTNATVRSSGSHLGTDDWVVAITYNFTVDGHTYESDSVYPGPTGREMSAFDAEKIADRYPEGETVTAYYDPADPSNSFLIKKRDTMAPIALIVVGGLLTLGFGSALVRSVLSSPPESV